MEQTAANERELMIKFSDAKKRKDEAKIELENANAEYEQIEAALIEALQARNAESTAKYEGIGFVSLVKPRLYARFDKENEEQVFEFLKQEGREDLVKNTVNTQSLSGYIGERLEVGNGVPDFIKYYLKPSVRFYGA